MISFVRNRWAEANWMPWLVWGLGSLFIAYQFSFQVSSAIMLKGWARDFHLNATGLGFLSSTFFYTYLILQVPIGLLVDRYGVRRILLAGIALFLLGLYLFMHAQHVAVASLARLMMGMAAAPAVAAGLCLGANWFSPGRFAMIVGLSEMMGAVGGMFGEGYMARWVEALGWRDSLWIWLVVGSTLFVLALLLVDDHPPHATTASKSIDLPKMGLYKQLRSALAHPQVWFNGLFCGLTFAVNSAFAGLWSVPYLEHVHGISHKTSAWLSTMVYVGVIIGSPMAGFLCDRFGRQDYWMRWGAFSGALCTVWFILLPSHHVFPLGLLLGLMGFFSAVYVIPFANVKHLVPLASRGAAMAFTNTCCIMIGAPMLQPFFGWVLHHGVAHGHKALTQAPVYTAAGFLLAAWSLVACALLAWLLSFKVKAQRYEALSTV